MLVDTGPIVASDLSLVALERSGVREIITVDTKDFLVYWLANDRALGNLLAP